MRAAVFEQFQTPLQIQDVADPVPEPDSVVISVRACGLCRSDWHGWMGHDSDVQLPHVPGHELAGEIVAVGHDVNRWTIGERVTVPFCCGCGTCEQCVCGNQQICDQYTQPGFTQWGAFAEYVSIRYADVNLVSLPDDIDFVTAASLGCRFATSFRAVVVQGRTQPGDWIAIHGCGGVGLSAIMIATALGARVIAIDIRQDRLEFARHCGAAIVVDASHADPIVAVRDVTSGGAHVSIDAFGSRTTCWNSVKCLRKRGRHVQIGLMLGSDADPPIPMGSVIANELEIIGSHGMQAFEYSRMLRMISAGTLQPELLISNRVTLTEAAALLPKMHEFPGNGVTVIDRMI
ncbi:MAG TPA: zinc-dependent alcohol dehydrogenase family protein [Planctomycetaceae bacterium]|nr:zinc-dependent alcohol dehydrogenase family protein [Planctomycetaceae bacterium]